jgi:hypothetical protein
MKISLDKIRKIIVQNSYQTRNIAIIIDAMKTNDFELYNKMMSFYREKPNDLNSLLKDFRSNGINKPIIINKNNQLIDGHHRVSFALLTGIKSLKCNIENVSTDYDHPNIDEPERLKDIIEKYIVPHLETQTNHHP